MPAQHRSLSISIACVVCLSAVVVQTTVYSGPPDAGQRENGHHAEATASPPVGWETIDFKNVADMETVGAQGLAVFAWLWRGAVDSDDNGSAEFANEPSPDTVAMLWDDPSAPSQTRIGFSNPVDAVFFDYALDTSFGALTVIAYDESGVPFSTSPLNVCGATSCGNSCSGDPTGELCDFSTVEIVAQPGRGISHIEFDGPSESLARFALDDLTYFEIHPIFVDGFETSDTAGWFEAIGLPPPCDEIEVGPLTWISNNEVRIATVRNLSSTDPIVHTRTKINWEKVRDGQYLDTIRFDEIGFVTTDHDSTPPTDVEIEISFDPDQSSPFTAAWAGWAYVPYCPIGGEIEVTLFFRYSGSNGVCTETRFTYRPTPVSCPHDTPTPTATPTNTHTPTKTPTASRPTPTPSPSP